MATKKKSSKGKRVPKRVDLNSQKRDEEKVKPQSPGPEAPRMPERIKEKDAGFGVIKVVVGAIIALIVGSMILFNYSGGREKVRGDKLPGELCDETAECVSGSICYSYKGREKRCMSTCSKKKPCEPGMTCVSAASQKRRKGFRLTDVCVEDAAL